MLTPEVIAYAFVGGLLPPLVWLYFLLHEDSQCPEPKPLIVLAFLAGMLAVPLVLPLETLAVAFLPAGLTLIVAWSVIEETMKYALAAIAVLWRREVNEPIDLVIYMLTAALGFAALENVLFLLTPLGNGLLLESIVTNNLRFIGATLLHILASSAIGFALAFSFRRRIVARALFAAGGLILAIALHAVFNFFIIEQEGAHALVAFFSVWIGVVVLLALFEVLRYLRYRPLRKNVC